MLEKREYEKEYKVQAVKLAKKSDQQKQRRSCRYRSTRCTDGSEKQMESPKRIGKPGNQTIF